MNIIFEMLVQCDTNIELNLCIYIYQGPIFHGPVIMSYILKTICWTYAIIGILVQYDTNSEFELYICRSVTYISRSSGFALYLEKG